MMIDHEERNLDLFKMVIDYFKEEQVIVSYTDSFIGIQEVQRFKPDICFLDIEILDVNWVQVAKELMDDDILVTLVMSYQQDFMEGFKKNVFDYIQKPITENNVYRVLDKFYQRLPAKSKDDSQSLAINFFGGFHVYYKGIELELPTEKTAELFSYLVFHQGKKVSKWELCDILWPNVLPEKAIHNVYNSIYLLKKVFEQTKVEITITNKKGYYELNLYDVKIDFQEMNDFANNRTHLTNPSILEYERIEKLYSGEFLSGKEYSWHPPLQVHYHQLYIHIVEEMLEYYLQNNDTEKAILLGQKVLRYTPQEETIARMMISFYIKKGSRELLQFYFHYSSYYEQQIGTKLSKETIHCFEAVLRNTPARSL